MEEQDTAKTEKDTCNKGNINIENEVKRILSKEEVNIAQRALDNTEKFQQFLQNKFNFIIKVFLITLAIFSFLFVFFFGKTYLSIDQTINDQVDNKVIEYRIVESYKKRLEAQIEIVLESDDIQSKINSLVNDEVSREVESRFETELKERISEEFRRIKDDDFAQLVERAVAKVVTNLKIDHGTIYHRYPHVPENGHIGFSKTFQKTPYLLLSTYAFGALGPVHGMDISVDSLSTEGFDYSISLISKDKAINTKVRWIAIGE